MAVICSYSTSFEPLLPLLPPVTAFFRFIVIAVPPGCLDLADNERTYPTARGTLAGFRRHVATQVATLRPSSRFELPETHFVQNAMPEC